MKKIIIVILSVVMLGTACFFAFGYYRREQSRRSAEKTVISFIDSANDQNVSSMLDHIEPTEAELIELGISKLDTVSESSAFSKCKKWLPYIADMTDLELIPQFDAAVSDSAVRDNSADVTAELTNKKTGKKTDCVFRLISIDGKWYIQYIRLNK